MGGIANFTSSAPDLALTPSSRPSVLTACREYTPSAAPCLSRWSRMTARKTPSTSGNAAGWKRAGGLSRVDIPVRRNSACWACSGVYSPSTRAKPSGWVPSPSSPRTVRISRMPVTVLVHRTKRLSVRPPARWPVYISTWSASSGMSAGWPSSMNASSSLRGNRAAMSWATSTPAWPMPRSASAAESSVKHAPLTTRRAIALAASAVSSSLSQGSIQRSRPRHRRPGRRGSNSVWL